MLTVETIPLRHRIRCSGFLFKEKIKPRRIDKTKLPEGLPLLQVANLKKGHDITDAEGNVLYKNADLTFDPRKSRSYAYCSDTAYNENMIDQIRDVDMLYHEATFEEDEAQKAAETFHSTARQAATIALKANAKGLLLGHFSARYKDLAPILKEAHATFENAHLAVEGDVFTLSD